jgi:hypothetical protein
MQKDVDVLPSFTCRSKLSLAGDLTRTVESLLAV